MLLISCWFSESSYHEKLPRDILVDVEEADEEAVVAPRDLCLEVFCHLLGSL